MWVLTEGYGYQVIRVVRETPAKWVVVSPPYTRERHILKAGVLAAGDEAAMVRLSERLTSSKALAREEARKAEERHKARTAKLIAAATSPTPEEQHQVEREGGDA